MKHKTSPEHESVIVCIFSFDVIWVVIFNVQTHFVTGFYCFCSETLWKIPISMAYYHIKMIGSQELELSFIKDEICQKIFTQLKYWGQLEINLNVKVHNHTNQ